MCPIIWNIGTRTSSIIRRKRRSFEFVHCKHGSQGIVNKLLCFVGAALFIHMNRRTLLKLYVRLPKLNSMATISTTNATIKLVEVIENEQKRTANVILKRPPVNCFNLQLVEQLTAAVKDLERKKFKGIILSSSSPKVFCAGIDLNEICGVSEDHLKKYWIAFRSMWKALYSTPMITIAAVNGHAPAGGCIITLSCDHSIMVRSGASIGLNGTSLGIASPRWVSSLLINAIGHRNAAHALKLGKLFSPEEALELNIVHELVDSPEDVLPRAHEEMDVWLKVPSLALQVTKSSLRSLLLDDFKSYEDKEADEMVQFFLQPETQEVLGKYFEKLKGKKDCASIPLKYIL